MPGSRLGWLEAASISPGGNCIFPRVFNQSARRRGSELAAGRPAAGTCSALCTVLTRVTSRIANSHAVISAALLPTRLFATKALPSTTNFASLNVLGIALSLQCTDTVGWAAGRASGL